MLLNEKLLTYDEYFLMLEQQNAAKMYHYIELYNDFSVQNFLDIINTYRSTNDLKYIFDTISCILIKFLFRQLN